MFCHERFMLHNFFFSTKFFCFRSKIDVVCNRLLANLEFLEKVENNSSFWTKYMRIRYEDFILNPLGYALKIYEFVGINMTLEVKQWLDVAMSVTNKDSLYKKSPSGLKRNVKTVLNNWRKDLSFPIVKEIQTKCEEILNILEYKVYKNNYEMKDVRNLHFKPNWSPQKQQK